MRHLLIFLIINFTVSFTPHASEAKEIRTIYLSNEPLLVTDEGDVRRGLFADLFTLAAKELGRTVKIVRLPWKRAQLVAESTPGSAVGPLTRTPKREDRFQWVAPLFQMRVTYLTKAGNFPRINSIEEARTKEIGIKRGTASVYAAKIHHLPEHRLQVLDSQKQLLQMLKIDRIDGWLVWDVLGYRAHKLFGSGIELAEGYSENLGDLYFASSKDVSDQEKQLWLAAFRKVIQRGDMTRLLEAYIGHSSVGGGPLLAYQ